jgi:hypothetical protein
MKSLWNSFHGKIYFLRHQFLFYSLLFCLPLSPPKNIQQTPIADVSRDLQRCVVCSGSSPNWFAYNPSPRHPLQAPQEPYTDLHRQAIILTLPVAATTRLSSFSHINGCNEGGRSRQAIILTLSLVASKSSHICTANNLGLTLSMAAKTRLK